MLDILRFRARIEIAGINPFVPVAADQAQSLKPDWRKPMPVLVRLDAGTPWRTNMMPKGDGSYFLYLHGEMRKAAGKDVGDVLEIEVRFDAEYRNGPLHAMPDWFAAALAEDCRAKAGWEELSPSRQKEILRYFAGLKGEEAKQRNLDRALRVLGGTRERFMARDWN